MKFEVTDRRKRRIVEARTSLEAARTAEPTGPEPLLLAVTRSGSRQYTVQAGRFKRTVRVMAIGGNSGEWVTHLITDKAHFAKKAGGREVLCGATLSGVLLPIKPDAPEKLRRACLRCLELAPAKAES